MLHFFYRSLQTQKFSKLKMVLYFLYADWKSKQLWIAISWTWNNVWKMNWLKWLQILCIVSCILLFSEFLQVVVLVFPIIMLQAVILFVECTRYPFDEICICYVLQQASYSFMWCEDLNFTNAMSVVICIKIRDFWEKMTRLN